MDDDDSSFEDRVALRRQQPPPVPTARKSSLSEELGRSVARKSIAASLKNATTFRDDEAIKEGAPEDEGAIVTDEEEEEGEEEEKDNVSESAIEDEVESDWEDSVTESGRSSVVDGGEKGLFKRVDSRANLVSRPSMLTMMMQQPPKMRNQMISSRSTSALQRARPNGPSVPDSPPGGGDHNEEGGLTMRGGVPRSNPVGVTPGFSGGGAQSPRTTRRNMLATELTESLRRHLLWERQQKSTTANAVLKRRHTSHDVANLQEYPQPNNNTNGGGKEKYNGSWNNNTDFGPWEYHAKGW